MNFGNLLFALFLTFLAAINTWFLHIAIKARKNNDSPQTAQLLWIALSETIWVWPCFIQCWLVFADITNNSTDTIACDIQGFYSTLSSLSSMVILTITAWMSYEMIQGKSDLKKFYWITPMLFVLVMLISMLPFFGHGKFSFMGAGFCYLDWFSSKAIAVLLLIIPSGSIIAFIAFSAISLSSDHRYKTFISVALFVYSLTWILWPVAASMALSDAESFPYWIMILGGILGHLSAGWSLPLYGVWWKTIFVDDNASACQKYELCSQKDSDEENNSLL